jgi:hypothetical protein
VGIKTFTTFVRFSVSGVYFYSKTNRMHSISNLFYFGTTLYMFRTVSPSIIRSLRLYIQHHVYVIQQAATEPVWHIPDAVCTVLDSWWWTERPSETCRALFQNKINLKYCASGWFYYRNILRCTVLQTSNQCRILSHVPRTVPAPHKTPKTILSHLP